MVSSVRLQNFKALRDVTMSLDRFTILVGPNASGKTSVLQGLHFLSLIGIFPPARIFRGSWAPEVIRSAGSNGPVVFEVAGKWEGKQAGLQLTLEERENPASLSRVWNYRIAGKWGEYEFQREEELDDSFLAPEEQQRRERGYQEFLQKDGSLLRLLTPFTFLRLDSGRLAAPSYSDAPVPWLKYDGEGLASVLAYMALKQAEDFQSLQESLRGVIPAVRRVRLDRAQVLHTEREPFREPHEQLRTVERTVWGHRVELDLEGAPNTPAEAVSEGTLLVLGLLTALLSPRPQRPRLVLLDDLDRGLHPKALRELVSVLRSTIEENPGMQIVATSHSPYLIDYFDAEEVRLTSTQDDGSVVAGTLSDHPEYERWKHTMAPGEFWSMVGEKWLTEPREHVNAKS